MSVPCKPVHLLDRDTDRNLDSDLDYFASSKRGIKHPV